MENHISFQPSHSFIDPSVPVDQHAIPEESHLNIKVCTSMHTSTVRPAVAMQQLPIGNSLQATYNGFTPTSSWDVATIQQSLVLPMADADAVVDSSCPPVPSTLPSDETSWRMEYLPVRPDSSFIRLPATHLDPPLNSPRTSSDNAGDLRLSVQADFHTFNSTTAQYTQPRLHPRGYGDRPVENHFIGSAARKRVRLADISNDLDGLDGGIITKRRSSLPPAVPLRRNSSEVIVKQEITEETLPISWLETSRLRVCDSTAYTPEIRYPTPTQIIQRQYNPVYQRLLNRLRLDPRKYGKPRLLDLPPSVRIEIFALALPSCTKVRKGWPLLPRFWKSCQQLDRELPWVMLRRTVLSIDLDQTPRLLDFMSRYDFGAIDKAEKRDQLRPFLIALRKDDLKLPESLNLEDPRIKVRVDKQLETLAAGSRLPTSLHIQRWDGIGPGWNEDAVRKKHLLQDSCIFLESLRITVKRPALMKAYDPVTRTFDLQRILNYFWLPQLSELENLCYVAIEVEEEDEHLADRLQKVLLDTQAHIATQLSRKHGRDVIQYMKHRNWQQEVKCLSSVLPATSTVCGPA